MDREQRIVQLIREGAKPRGQPHQIVVRGDGNVLGDMITISRSSSPSKPSAKRGLRASAISYIRSTCRALGAPDLYRSFAISQFGDEDLDQLTLHELERIRGWVAARHDQFHGGRG